MESHAQQPISLRLLACLKQVRQPESAFELTGGRVQWPGSPLLKMSAADEFALEEALAVKDAQPGAHVTALTLGPPSAGDMLRRALGMGADATVRLEAEEESLRPHQVAQAIAAWAGTRGFDLMMCGVMSEDAMAGLVGPLLAESLNIPYATAVVALELNQDRRLVRVEREMEGGRRQALELPLPALLTIQSGPRAPRYPTLSGLLRAKKTVLPSLAVADLALPAPREQVLGLRPPGRARAGLVLQGSTQDKAAGLYAILRERAWL